MMTDVMRNYCRFSIILLSTIWKIW